MSGIGLAVENSIHPSLIQVLSRSMPRKTATNTIGKSPFTLRTVCSCQPTKTSNITIAGQIKP